MLEEDNSQEMPLGTNYTEMQAVIFTDVGGVCQDANPAAVQLLGYSLPKLTGMHMDTLLAGGERPFHTRQKSPAANQPARVRLQPRTGAPLPVLWRQQPVRLGGGLWLMITLQPLETPGPEEQLPATDPLMRTILGTVPIGVAVLIEERFVLVSKYFCDLVGYARDELVGQSTRIIQLAAEEFETVSQANGEEGDADELEKIETQFLHKDGTPCDVQLSRTFIDPAAPERGVIYIVQNIIERKQAEQALRRSEARYRAIAENFPNGIIALYDHDLRYQLVYGKGLRDSGLTAGDFEGRRLRDIFPPEVYKRDEPALLASLQGEMTETVVPFGDDYFRVMTLPVKDEQGQIINGMVLSQNITPLKNIELELKNTLEQLELAINTAKLGIWRLNVGSGELQWNDRLFEMYGLSRDEFEGNVDGWREQVHPDDRAYADGRLAVAFDGEPVYDVEFRLQHPDGELRYINASATPIRDEQGNLVELIGINIDVTSLKKNEAVLREHEAFLQAIFDHSMSAIVVADDEGNYFSVNQAAAEMFGYPIETILQMNVRDLQTSSSPSAADRFTRYIAEGRETGEFDFINGRGERRVTQYQAVRVDENFNLSMLMDITEQKQVMNALRQRNQALEQSPVSVIITDTRGNVQYVNPKFSEITGYQPEEVIGRNPRLLKSGEHSPAFYQEMWQTIIRGHEWRGELHNRNKNGELYWELTSISGVKDELGRITHYVSVREDITRRKQLEEEHVRQERLAAVGQLAAGIAHDFNNILASILLHAQLAVRTGDLSARDRDRMTVIEDQAWHASRLIEQILDFSRRGMLEERPLNLVPLLKEQVALLRRTLPEHIIIQLDVDREEQQVRADPTRMQQMITNLALNARDAMPRGGRLVIGVAQLEIGSDEKPPVAGMEPGLWTRLTVTDDGSGISPEVKQHIFEPFFTTKKPGEGSGLGLAQVYGIVAQHGGFIDVETAVNHGTSFKIYVPNFAALLPPSSPTETSNLPPGGGKTVLIVEDDEVLREALCGTLSQLDYHVREAEHGKEALAVLEQHGDDIVLVISDIVMPVMGGTSLFEQMRRRGWDLPVVFLTGHPLGKEIDRLRDQGLVACLTKPVKLEVLAQLISVTLNE